MGKKVLSDEETNSIITEYKDGSIGIETLACKYKVGKLKIRAILDAYGVSIKSKGAQVTIGNSGEVEQSKIRRYESSNNDKVLVAICKRTGKKYDDVNNLSGKLTTHVINVYGDVPIPKNNYQRKKYELANGKKWFEDYFNIVEEDNTKIIKYKTCDLVVENKLSNNIITTFNSKQQKEIEKFISEELMLTFLINNKKILHGTSIDLYIPSLRIGIEYNGLYWHSEKMGKTRNYHQSKTILAEGEDIRLIHIFEDEWNNKQDIVKNRLRHILGKTKDRIYARKCVIKEITANQKKYYLEDNHIQGNDNSTIRLGLFHNDILVGVMTFSKPRKSLGYNKTDDNSYELVRFASDNVIGGADKLLKYFIKKHKPNKIISYADRRWSQGDLYQKLGFDFMGTTKPNYWYTKDYRTREHRFNYRKDVLVSKGYDSDKTEFEIMNELGYERIWDCGSFKFEMIL